MAENAARNTHKTDAVMKLLTGNDLAVNPMLDNEFKQSVIEMRTSAEAEKTSAAEETAVREQNIHLEGASEKTKKKGSPSEICISSELITEILPVALNRFHCCNCGKCFAEAMTDALEAVPYVSVKIHGRNDAKRVNELKKQHRRDVMRAIIRIAISRRSLPKHENQN